MGCLHLDGWVGGPGWWGGSPVARSMPGTWPEAGLSSQAQIHLGAQWVGSEGTASVPVHRGQAVCCSAALSVSSSRTSGEGHWQRGTGGPRSQPRLPTSDGCPLHSKPSPSAHR